MYSCNKISLIGFGDMSVLLSTGDNKLSPIIRSGTFLVLTILTSSILEKLLTNTLTYTRDGPSERKRHISNKCFLNISQLEVVIEIFQLKETGGES